MTSTTIVDNRPLTANVLLFGAKGQSAEALGHAISQHDASRAALRSVRRLSGSAAVMVDREIATAADGLLDLDLGDMLVAAWQKHERLAEAARRTLANDGSEEVVSLTSHSIQSTYSPHVDLKVSGNLVHCFRFVLEILVEVDTLDAVVRDGTLATLRGGDCMMTATLRLDGVRLAAARRTATVDTIVALNQPRSLITTPVAA